MTASTDLTSVISSTDLAMLLDPGTSLNEFFAKLDSAAPPANTSKKSVMPKAIKLPEKIQAAMEKLPAIFGQVQPATRRKAHMTELKKLEAEKKLIDLIVKALGDRKTAIAEIVSTHFDCVAEESGKANDDTSRDPKGHYRIASPGNPERQLIDGSESVWHRERKGDTTTPNQALMESKLAVGEISQEDVDLITTTVTMTVIDEGKIRQGIVSQDNRPRVLALLKEINTTTPGGNAVYLR